MTEKVSPGVLVISGIWLLLLILAAVAIAQGDVNGGVFWAIFVVVLFTFYRAATGRRPGGLGHIDEDDEEPVKKEGLRIAMFASAFGGIAILLVIGAGGAIVDGRDEAIATLGLILGAGLLVMSGRMAQAARTVSALPGLSPASTDFLGVITGREPGPTWFLRGFFVVGVVPNRVIVMRARLVRRPPLENIPCSQLREARVTDSGRNETITLVVGSSEYSIGGVEHMEALAFVDTIERRCGTPVRIG